MWRPFLGTALGGSSLPMIIECNGAEKLKIMTSHAPIRLWTGHLTYIRQDFRGVAVFDE